jgi:hypothetical protein
MAANLKVLDSLVKGTGTLQDKQPTSEYYESAPRENITSSRIRKERISR